MKKIPTAVLLIISGILLYFIVSDKWIGSDGKSWRFIVDTDGKGYYAYLPAVFIYHDLYFDFVERNEKEIGCADPRQIILSNGQRGNRYFIGEALLITPFFLVAWIISWLGGYSLTGYNCVFFCSVSIATLFYLIAGLVFLSKVLRLFNVRELIIQALLVMTVFGTNVFHYAVYEPSMSHIYSFASVGAFLYFIKKYQLSYKHSNLLYSGAALGIITLIRPVNVIIILALPFLTGSFGQFKLFLSYLVRDWKYLILSCIAFSVIVFIQLLISYMTFGEYFHWQYQGEGFDFLDPHFIDTLFSYRKGLFVYTPLIFISVLFIIVEFKKSVYNAISFIIFFIILNYILSSWSFWSYGGSYGLRAFIEYYPLFILPLGIGLNEIRSKFILFCISFIFTAVLLVNLIQTYQYEHNIIHFVNMDKEKYWKVFLRTSPRYKMVCDPIKLDTLNRRRISMEKDTINDFEGKLNWGANNTITSNEHYSGNYCAKLEIPNCFSPAFMIKYSELPSGNMSYILVELKAKVSSYQSQAALVISFENRIGDIYKYETYPISLVVEKLNSWQPVKYGVHIPKMEKDDVLKTYVWNNTEHPVYIDDFNVRLITEK